MRFTERSYGGNVFRPRPEVEFSDSDQFLCISTPWGSRSTANNINQMIRDHYLSARSDKESTSPFDRLTCLSSIANDLRISMKLANDVIYSEANREEYVTGAEVLVLAIDGKEVTWGSLGQPAVFLDRPNSIPIPLAGAADLATELSDANQQLPPLPAKLLGTDSHTDFEMHSIQGAPGQALLFIARSFLPQGFFDLAYGSRSLEDISRLCSNDDPEQAFWIGRLEF